MTVENEIPTRGRQKHPVRGESRTRQADALASDINAIMDRYVHHGVLPSQNAARPRYGDFSSGLDYHAALLKVQSAEDEFMALPAHVRRYVDNDPGRFLELVHDPERRDELVELGLVEEQLPAEPAEPDPQPAPAEREPAEEPPAGT